MIDRIRPEIRQMTPYTPIKPFHVLSAELGIPIEQIVKLDANENPYGASPKALQALNQLGFEMPIYPDPASGDLAARLATELGVSPDMLVIGAGADELIELLFKLFIAPNDAIINCPPTFGMYTFCAAIAGANEIEIWRDENYQLDIDAIERAVEANNAKMVFITSPNNPDGGVISRPELNRLLALDTLVVLDEAYIAFDQSNLAGEFGENNSARLVAQHDNLVVLRTFSKWAGLAGLRCGYGIFPTQIAAYLMTIKQPYNVNIAARAAALASLDDLSLLARNVDTIRQERERLYGKLSGFDFLKPLQGSRANFILVKVLERSAAELKTELAQRGMLVRYFAKARLENHIRISVGTPQQTDQLIETLEAMA